MLDSSSYNDIKNEHQSWNNTGNSFLLRSCSVNSINISTMSKTHGRHDALQLYAPLLTAKRFGVSLPCVISSGQSALQPPNCTWDPSLWQCWSVSWMVGCAFGKWRVFFLGGYSLSPSTPAGMAPTTSFHRFWKLLHLDTRLFWLVVVPTGNVKDVWIPEGNQNSLASTSQALASVSKQIASSNSMLRKSCRSAGGTLGSQAPQPASFISTPWRQQHHEMVEKRGGETVRNGCEFKVQRM